MAIEIEIPLVGKTPLEYHVYELRINDHVKFVNPLDFGLLRDGIDPADYFITSGDAVFKAKALERDFGRHYNDLRDELLNGILREFDCSRQESINILNGGYRFNTQLHDYMLAVFNARNEAQALLEALMAVRGVNCFLETEWDDRHRLLCIPKNPRERD